MLTFNLKFKKMLLALSCLAMLVACEKKSDISTDNQAVSLQSLSDKMSGLRWTYNNGTVAPPYQYSVSYQVDFQLRQLVISVDKGASVSTSLPTPTTKSLSDSQINSLRNLVAGVSVQSCAKGSMIVGGGIDSISLSTSSLSVSDIVVYGTDCTGITDSNARQGQSSTGYGSLSNYLQSI
jgi:hypothetical protein